MGSRWPFADDIRKRHQQRDVAIKLAELCATFQPAAIAFDRWGMPELERIMSEEGISNLALIPHGQGFSSMSPSTKSFEERILNRQLIADFNPVLAWCVSNVSITRDAVGNMKPDKQRSREKIDCAVAAVMAVGAAPPKHPPKHTRSISTSSSIFDAVFV